MKIFEAVRRLFDIEHRVDTLQVENRLLLERVMALEGLQQRTNAVLHQLAVEHSYLLAAMQHGSEPQEPVEGPAKRSEKDWGAN